MSEETLAPGPTGSRGMAPSAGLVLGAFVLVGLGASVLHLCPGPAGRADRQVSLAVPDWRPDRQEVDALEGVALARRSAAPGPSDEDAEALVKAYMDFNEVDARVDGDPRSRDLADAHATYQQWARSALRRLGEERYMGLGQLLADDFLKALARGDGAMLDRLGGTFVDHLRATGLVTPERKPGPGANLVVRTAFVTRWAQVVRDERPTASLLTPEERRLLLRWKLAANPLIDPERRGRIAAELRRLGSDYPVMEALAARAAHDGDWGRAARLYAEAARERPDDANLRRAAELAAARAQSRRPSRESR